MNVITVICCCPVRWIHAFNVTSLLLLAAKDGDVEGDCLVIHGATSRDVRDSLEQPESPYMRDSGEREKDEYDEGEWDVDVSEDLEGRVIGRPPLGQSGPCASSMPYSPSRPVNNPIIPPPVTYGFDECLSMILNDGNSIDKKGKATRLAPLNRMDRDRIKEKLRGYLVYKTNIRRSDKFLLRIERLRATEEEEKKKVGTKRPDQLLDFFRDLEGDERFEFNKLLREEQKEQREQKGVGEEKAALLEDSGVRGVSGPAVEGSKRQTDSFEGYGEDCPLSLLDLHADSVSGVAGTGIAHSGRNGRKAARGGGGGVDGSALLKGHNYSIYPPSKYGEESSARYREPGLSLSEIDSHIVFRPPLSAASKRYQPRCLCLLRTDHC